MTTIGTLVECIEDAEITQQITHNSSIDINFYKDILYTSLISDEIYIIDREHNNIKVTKKFFNKHFKIK